MSSLANEFQQKQALQAKQFAPKQTGPKEHPEDTLIVCNILVGDDNEIQEVIPYANARPSIDPSTGQQHFINQIDTNIYEHSWNTSEFFEVRWDGRPHRIRAGETRRMPRYLADHFAKHLIDYILIEREKREKVTGLLKHRGERAKLYKEIIQGVDSYYNGDMFDYEREGTYVEQQVGQLNQPDNSLNLGEMPPVALGFGTTDKPPEKIDVEPEVFTPPDTKPQTPEELIASKTIGQLRSEAKQLGIEIKPTMNKEALSAAILNF